MNWWKDLKGNVRLSEPLKAHTSFKIGGPAKLFFEPRDKEDLKLLLNLLKRYKIPFLIIGAGSNILVSDRGVNAAVIHLGAPYFKKFSFKKNYLQANSGALLARVILAAAKEGLGGCEFLAGIPGTLGGALVMNAGISGKDKNIARLIKDVTVIDRRGKVKTLKKKQIRFGYRFSSLSKYIILGARLELFRKNRKKISQEIKAYLKQRQATQDVGWASAGCVFKNPPGDSTGRLADLCGLKEKKSGGACISSRHANFILNRGNAKSSDVMKLMALMRKEVKNRFAINLKPEIKIWQ